MLRDAYGPAFDLTCCAGCATLRNIAAGDKALKQAVADAGGAAAIVSAMRQHPADVDVQRRGCEALRNIAVRGSTGDDELKQAVVDAGGAAAIVSAMRQHAANELVQRRGCAALRNIAAGENELKQAVVEAGGAAAIVSAMTQHAADVVMQRRGVEALGNLAAGESAPKQAVVDAAEKPRHTPTDSLHIDVAATPLTPAVMSEEGSARRYSARAKTEEGEHGGVVAGGVAGGVARAGSVPRLVLVAASEEETDLSDEESERRYLTLATKVEKSMLVDDSVGSVEVGDE
jgi:hypothetical protein